MATETAKRPLVEDAEPNEETALANRDDGETSLDIPRGYATFMEDNDELFPEDYYIKVGHGQSAEVKEGEREVGDIFIPDHDSLKAVTLVPLGYQLKRTLWELGMPICRSFGGVTGEGEPGGNCGTCPENDWKEVRGRRIKACQTSQSFQCWSVEWGKVVILDLKSTAARVARKVKTWHDTEGGFPNFAMRMTTRETSNRQGSWRTPVLNLVPMTPEIKAQIPTTMGGTGEGASGRAIIDKEGNEMPF